jgi:predicted porin
VANAWTTSAITFRASEDLGGGLTAAATITTAAAGGALGERDQFLTLSGGFGSVMIGTVEAGNGIVGLGNAGAPVRGFQNKYGTKVTEGGRDYESLLAATSNVDIIQYTSPAMNGFTVRANMTDKVGAGGRQAAAAAQTSTSVGVRYAAGPLTVDADYTKSSRNGLTPSSSAFLGKDRTRISASYNLGVARIGAGMERRTLETGAATTRKQTDTIIGISAPVASNITVGVTRGTSDNFKGVAGSKKGSGTEFGIKYDFSKRTSLTAQTSSYKSSTPDANQGTQTLTRVFLAHSF